MSELQDTADHLVVVGRGKVIADRQRRATSSRPPPTTGSSCAPPARAEAMTVLAHAGAEVAATAPDVLTVTGLSAERSRGGSSPPAVSRSPR